MVVFDVLGLAFALWAAYALRHGEIFRPDPEQFLLIFAAPVVALPVFYAFGLYRAVTRYLPERAIWTFAGAVTAAVAGWVTLAYVAELVGPGTVPRSVPIIYWMLAVMIVGGGRLVAKRFLAATISTEMPDDIIVYGAGQPGAQLAAALTGNSHDRIAAFVDDDPDLIGRDFCGRRVYGSGDLADLVSRLGIKEIVISTPSIEPERRAAILHSVGLLGPRINILPALSDVVTGKYLVSQVREFDIDELLGRSVVPPDEGLLAQVIEGRNLLVTGAGGSIGSELCRLIARWHPNQLVLLEANEFALYRIDEELQRLGQFDVVPVLGSVGDSALLDQLLSDTRFDTVFHAAAHKHVPMVEANVIEGIRNNVLGTRVFAEATRQAGIANFILISSDKAVRPTSVMGATKRWAELIVRHQARLADANGTGQRFCAVRFGNVLGSNGSVVPKFREQIAAGGPLTLTDPAMTRYFMSIHEAIELIVQSSALGDNGDILVLDMGQSILMRDLAETMIRLAGRSVRDGDHPEGDIAITVTGPRSGEKTHEELFYDPASVLPTRQPKILRETSPNDVGDLISWLDILARHVDARDEEAAKRLLYEVISLDQTMSTKLRLD